MAGQIQTLQEMINQVVKGKQKVVEKVLCAMLAGGHILLEDIPGVGLECEAGSRQNDVSDGDCESDRSDVSTRTIYTGCAS